MVKYVYKKLLVRVDGRAKTKRRARKTTHSFGPMGFKIPKFNM
jgi:hypothetical protein